MNELPYEETDVEEEDAVILELGNMMLAQDARTAIINPRKIAQMELCYMLLRELTQTPGMTLGYRLHEPFKSMGSITLEADKLIIRDPEILATACKLASNVDCYPLINGRVRMDFAFDGLTIPIE